MSGGEKILQVYCIGTADTKLEELRFLSDRVRSDIGTFSKGSPFKIWSLKVDLMTGSALYLLLQIPFLFVDKSNYSMVKKIVLKVNITCQKCKRKLIQSVAVLEGIDTIEVDSEKHTLTVTGDADPVEVVKQTRKVGKCAEVVSVGPPPKPEPEKPKPKPEPKPEPDPCPPWPPKCCPTVVPVCNLPLVPVYHGPSMCLVCDRTDSQICSIM